MRQAAGLALLATTILGCAARAQVVVVIDADPAVQTHPGFSHLHLYVRSAGTITNDTSIGHDETLPQPLRWPVHVVLSPSGDNFFSTPGERFEIVVGAHEAHADGPPDQTIASPFVTTRARSGYVRGETRVLQLHLDAACINEVCSPGDTCGGQGCVPVPFFEPTGLPTAVVGPVLLPTAEVTFGGRFGASVATSNDGRVIAVAVPRMSQVRVYTDGVESIVQTGTAADAGNIRVALSANGQRLAVGWTDRGTGGEVDTFQWDGTRWMGPVAVSPTTSPGAGSRFGNSLALNADGGVLAVGAPDAGGTGAVYVFNAATETSWVGMPLAIAGLRSGDALGTSVALSQDGTTLAVGAPGDDASDRGVFTGPATDFGASDSGAVYVCTGAGWSSQVRIKLSPSDDLVNTGDGFGAAVALDRTGNALLIGAPAEDSSGTRNGGAMNNLAAETGAAYLFTRTLGAWAATAYLKPLEAAPDSRFGTALAISPDGLRFAIGAPTFDLTVGGDEGAVYAYSIATNQFARLDAPMGSTSQALGKSVALGASVLVAGAPLTNDSLGAVFVYR